MAESLAHSKWVCKYHIVFSPKYRRKIIYNQLRADIQQYIRDLCKWKGVEILEGHMMPDHVHLLLSIPPKYCVSSFMGYLKGKSAMMIFEKHGNLKYKFGNRHFWATGYYVSTVGLNEATIKKYIREQEKQDMLEDKLTVWLDRERISCLSPQYILSREADCCKTIDFFYFYYLELR